MTGLPKQVQSFPFVQGPDTKSDPKLAQKPSRLENAVFRGGSVQKRWGRTQLTRAIQGGATQGTGKALFGFNEELVRINTSTTYGLSSATGEWVPKPVTHNYCTVSNTQLVQTTVTQQWPDQAQLNGVGVVAWCENDGANVGVHIAVYDVTTGTFFQDARAAQPGTVGNTFRVTRCVPIGSSIAVYAYDAGGNLFWTYVDVTSPSTVPQNMSAIRTDVYAASRTFDAIAYGAGIIILFYPSGAGTDLTGMVLTQTGGNASIVVAFAGAYGVAGGKAGIALATATNGNVGVFFGDSTAGTTKRMIVTGSLVVVTSAGAIINNGAWSGGAAGFVVGTALETSTNSITAILSQPYGGSSDPFMYKVVMNAATGGSVVSEIPSSPGLWVTCGLAPFAGTFVYGAVNSDVLGSPAALQCTGWVINTSADVVARVLPESSGIATDASYVYARVANSLTTGPTAGLLFSQLGRLSYASANAASASGIAVQTTPLGVSRIDVTLTSANALSTVRVGETLYMGGGLPRAYDGHVFSETGFELFPTAAVVDGGGGGLLSAGTYQWKFLYSWFNSAGELVRGIVSPPVSVALADLHKATISVYPMPLSTWDVIPGGPVVVIEVYRTTANGTIFYRQSSVTSPTLNVTTYASTTAGVIVITDNTSDTNLVLGEILYTTGGILDWEPPPAYAASCAHEGRLVVLSLEDRYLWAPSSKWVPGQMVRFSSFTQAHVPSSTGPLVGCASMDGKLILFTSQTAYLVIGDGPDQLGSNPYPPPERIISVDSGPLPGTPIVETPLGLMYQSTNGISLLDRGLNAQLIGADVVQFSTGLWTLKSAFLDSSAQQVRFLLDMGRDVPGAQMGTLVPSLGGVSLVYDYFYSQWSVFPNYGGQASCEYQGQYTMVRSDGVCWQEVPSTFLDQGVSVSSLVETPWIKQAGLQGFQRLWYATLLGTFGSACTINWDTAFSYSTSSPAVPVYETANSTSLDGSGVFDIGGALEFRHFIGAKCSAVKFRFYDSGISGSGQGMGLTDLSIEWGVRKGVFKLPAIQTA